MMDPMVHDNTSAPKLRGRKDLNVTYPSAATSLKISDRQLLPLHIYVKLTFTTITIRAFKNVFHY